MNDMKRYKLGGIFASVLLIFSIFTLLSISEVNAEEVISVNAKGYENTIIIEFENESASEIKTIKMWLGGDATFKSFKAESDWGYTPCLLYTSPSPRDLSTSRMPSSA